MDIHGYVIVHKETGERWGQVFNSIGGAKNSYNSDERQRHYYGHDCVLCGMHKQNMLSNLW